MCRVTAPIGRPCQHFIGGVNELYIANLDDILAWVDSDSDDILDTAEMGQVSITGITAANPGVVTTASAHGFSVGQTIWVVGTSAMTGLVGQHVIGTTPSSTTFTLTGFDTTSLAAFGSSVVSAVPMPFVRISTDDNVVSATANHKITGGNYYEHIVSFKITRSDQPALDVIDQMSLAKMVALIKTKTGVWQVFGRENGLSVRADDGIVIANGPTAADSGITVTITGDSTLPLETVIITDIPMVAA